MVRVKLGLVMVIVCLATLLAVACKSEPSPSPVSEVSPLTEISEEGSQAIAEEFVRGSPTFDFDGIEKTLKLTKTLTAQRPDHWSFTFEFDSRAAGYGDRPGKMLAQVITHHRAVITVEQMEITSAVMDEKWDMLSQREIK